MKLLEISQKLAKKALFKRLERYKTADIRSPNWAREMNKKMNTLKTHTRWNLYKAGMPRKARRSGPRYSSHHDVFGKRGSQTSPGVVNKTSGGTSGKGTSGYLPALAGAAVLAGGGYLAYKYLTRKKNSNKTKESSMFRESTDQAFMNLKEGIIVPFAAGLARQHYAPAPIHRHDIWRNVGTGALVGGAYGGSQFGLPGAAIGATGGAVDGLIYHWGRRVMAGTQKDGLVAKKKKKPSAVRISR